MTTVLIVDDSQFSLGRVRAAVQEFDSSCEVESHGSGESALQFVEQSGAPDFAIVDYNMPEMDGIELCRRLLRTMPADRVSILTADVGFEEQKALVPAGVGVINKPITGRKIAAFLSTEP